MNDSVYAVVAYFARYWFAGLAVIIIWRAIIWMRKDADRVSRVQRKLPDAGYIGEWAVVASEVQGIPAGLVMRATRDGWIGSARACDIRLRNAAVPARAARFVLRSDGLHLLPQRRGILLVDGEPVQREAVMRHGATLTVGGVTMQLRLFAGVLLEGEAVIRPSRRKGRHTEEIAYVDAVVDEDAWEEENDAYYSEDFIGESSDDTEDWPQEDQAEEEDGILAGYAPEATQPHVVLPKPALTVRRRRRNT